jgi:hypothetical protein
MNKITIYIHITYYILHINYILKEKLKSETISYSIFLNERNFLDILHMIYNCACNPFIVKH